MEVSKILFKSNPLKKMICIARKRTFEFSFITGIKIENEQIPSGVYSALERSNITDSVLKSFNDVNLRWIAKENWKYSIDFNGT